MPNDSATHFNSIKRRKSDKKSQFKFYTNEKRKKTTTRFDPIFVQKKSAREKIRFLGCYNLQGNHQKSQIIAMG